MWIWLIDKASKISPVKTMNPPRQAIENPLCINIASKPFKVEPLLQKTND